MNAIPRLAYLPLDVATSAPTGLIHHFKGCWWSAMPERGLIFYVTGRQRTQVSPQCNPDVRISRRLTEQMYPGAECVLVASVFVRATYDGGLLLPKDVLDAAVDFRTPKVVNQNGVR